MQYLVRRKRKMKKILSVAVSAIALMGGVSHAQTNYNDSIYNYKNSPYNYANSPYNYENSPYNYKNSQFNYNSPNGVYDRNGNRIGYKTRTDEGVTNYFDNRGDRKGYSTNEQD
jgi:hypothetical protein